ncbi:HNH endonuclease [Vibrio parahaemolyticus]
MNVVPLTIPLSIAILSTNALAATTLIKLSTSGICHDESSTSYKRTKNFTAFDTIEDCLSSGGRLPKSTATAKTTASSNEYSRDKFGHGWADRDNDCQDSRAEALISQSVGQVHFNDKKNCRVISGRWTSLFTGNTIYDASKIDIDHVVPLKFAWKHGADKWTNEQRESFANDQSNLIAVEASLNRQKGAKGIGDWLPPKNQCQYIVRFKRIVSKYNVILSNDEKIQYKRIQTKYCTTSS